MDLWCLNVISQSLWLCVENVNLLSLRYRRHRGDMIEAFKYLHGIYKVENILKKESNRYETRTNGLALAKDHCHLAARANFFSQRVPHSWNGLPEHVAQAPSVNAFKARLDQHLKYSTKFPLISRAQSWEDRPKGVDAAQREKETE